QEAPYFQIEGTCLPAAADRPAACFGPGPGRHSRGTAATFLTQLRASVGRKPGAGAICPGACGGQCRWRRRLLFEQDRQISRAARGRTEPAALRDGEEGFARGSAGCIARG